MGHTVQDTLTGNVEDAMLTILGRSHELSWGRSLLVVQLGVRQAFTVAEVVRTAVRVFGSRNNFFYTKHKTHTFSFSHY